MQDLTDIFQSVKIQVLLCVLGVVIGIITGSIDALFGIVLEKLTEFRQGFGWVFLLTIPIGAYIVSLLYYKFGGVCKKGMGLVFEVEEGKAKKIPLLLIPFAIVGTWITHLVGGSAGREGVAMQIGATVSNWFANKVCLENASRYFLPIGMAAGFAGLFQTPLASVLFAMEVMVAGEIRYPILLPALVASFVASNTSAFLGLPSSAIGFDGSLAWNGHTMLILVLLGVLFGIVGLAFSYYMHAAQHKAAQVFPNPMRKAVVLGCVLSVSLILLHSGRYSGAGGNLITYAVSGKTIYAYDWFLKAVLTILTMSCGLMGGEVVPLFTIGAALGAVVGPLLGIDGAFAAMLGYAAVFAAGTNTFFAAMFVGAEVFGFQYIPYLFVVCAVAYACNKNGSIYSLQKSVFPRRNKKEEENA